MNLEALLTSPDGFRLTTASPLQRAMCRMRTGVPLAELSDLPAVVEAIGGAGALSLLPNVAPSLVVILAAIRTAKSIMEAAVAFRATQTVNLDGIRTDEIARYSIISLDKDKARAIFEHLTGALNSSEALKNAVLSVKADSVLLLHPSGRAVEIMVTAGRKAGGSLVARWSIGCSFDEAPRLQGQSEGVVNLPDALTAVRGRLLPGAQIGLPGSPWAPRGPIYDLFVERFGRPGADVLFMVAKGPDMNPAWFTPEFCAKLLREDPRAHRTDVLALFADPEDSLLSSIDVEKCTRSGPLHLNPIPGVECVATIDPATRRNAWTLTVLRTPREGFHQVVLAKQWMGSKSAPLSPRAVFQEIAKLLEPYDVTSVWSDQASYDSLRELAEEAGITLWQDDFTEAGWRSVAKILEKHVSEHTIELPPDAAMRADILGMQRRLTGKSWTVLLPTTGDGRHGDYAPSLCLALKHAPQPPDLVQSANDYDADEKRVLDFINSSRSNPMRAAGERLRSAFS